MILSQLRIIVLVFRLHLKQLAVDWFIIFVAVVQPLIVALIAIYMLHNEKSFDPIFVIVGSGLTGLWSGTLFFSSINMRFERSSGTLELLVASPTPLYIVIVGKSLANIAMSCSSMIFSYLIAAFIFGFHLHIADPLLFVFSLFLGLVSLIATGLVIAPLVFLNPGSDVWANALEFPVYILGGFLFPITILPRWTWLFSYLLPLYWTAHVLHGTSDGNLSFHDVFICWGMLIAFSSAYLLLSLWLFKVLLYRAKVQATLGLQ